MRLVELLNRQGTRERTLPAFNVFDLASLRGALKASAETECPVITQFSARTVIHLGPSTCVAMVAECANAFDVQAFTHLDHCIDPDLVRAAVEAGFDGVMFDGSHLSPEENIRATRSVVDMAGGSGVAVEGELTPIAGEEDGFKPRDRESESIDTGELMEFVRRTGVSLVGADIGTKHGHYASIPDVDVESLRQIVANLTVGFVVHGGSGLPSSMLAQFVESGVRKVNFSTDLKVAWGEGARQSTEPLEGLKASEEYVRKACLEKMRGLQLTR